MSLMEKMKKTTTSKYANQLSKSEVFNRTEEIITDVPVLNVAMRGSLGGGMTAGILGICGESRHFKTNFALKIAAAFMRQNKDGVILFIDSEFGSPQSYFETYGIDTNRVFHVPVTNLEEMTFELTQQIDQFSRDDKVLILIDSLGNIASKREQDNALEGKGTADMSRAAKIKSLFRLITSSVRLKNIPLIFINHIYKEQTGTAYAKNIVSGGQGPMLAANDLWIITRAQDKDSDGDLNGYKFTINIEKSRFVKEKTKIPVTVSFDNGINLYSGILDLAIDGKFVMKPSNGWYQLVDETTGEMVGTKVRAADTETKEFLGKVIANKKFQQFVKDKYQLIAPKLDEDSSAEEVMSSV